MEPAALVLVVDDNESSRFVKTQIVRRAGFAVIEAETGRSALDLARRHPIDLVLLDVNLPDINGFDVCDQLKASGGLPAVPVLHISATAVSDADRVRGLTGGADAYIVEPSDPDVIVATLRALLRARRAERDRAIALELERQARQVAEEANRAKDEFLAALSHELRTPLNSILGWTSLLNRGELDAEGQKRAIDALDRSARVQWRLIDELLDAARVRERKMRLEISEIDLSQIGAAVIEAVKADAVRKGIRLTMSTRPTVIQGDGGRLQQVITNLLNNAIQFTPEGGDVALRIEPDGDAAVVDIVDSGIGIEREFLPNVFEQFRQADSVKEGHGGLGLGLAIARHIVDLHGGRISAHSDGLGCGARFVVRVPRQRDPVASSAVG
jgi:two-component system, sensor histidine kinase